MSGASRVSIPNNVKKTIQNIKEIAGNHSDDEIYAMLKECSMDPNETAQKLLLQDTFHEVRRKRDKRKENLNNKDSADSRWKPGTQGRGGRGARGNYSSRYISHDAGGGRAATAGKENGVNQVTEQGVTPSSVPPSQETESKAKTLPSSSLTPTTGDPTNAAYGLGSASSGCHTNHPVDSSVADANKFGSVLPPPINTDSTVASRVRVTTIHEVGSKPTTVDSNSVVPTKRKSTASENVGDHLQIEKLISHDVTNSQLSSSMNEKAASDIGNSFMHEKMPTKSQGVEKTQVLDPPQPSSSSTHGGASTGRPSSNYGNRPQQLIGSQKAVGPTKEWKPKPTTPNPSLVPATIGTSEVGTMRAEAGAESLPTVSASSSETATSKLQKKLEELHFSPGQHVIIPNHLQVPEAERSGLSFGSFDASFGVRSSYGDSPDSDKSSTPLSESSEGIEEAAEDPSSSNQNASPDSPEVDYHHHPQSPRNMPENSSPGEVESTVPEYDQSKPEMALPPAGPHYSVVHTAPTYSSFGLMPPMLGTQFASFDSSEPQGRDVSRLPGFVVQQPFDPSTSYYTQLYRPGADVDGRISPFLSPGAPGKYNGNIAVLSQQSSQSPQESGNSLVLSTAGPTPVVTQAAGVMQSSIAMTQPSVPVFRQPAGVHISHYPPNYIPYSQFFSPFYVPPPTIHHFLSNPTFPQQPPTGNVYPSPAAAAAATGVKYSFPHFKPGTNTGNTTHMGMPTGYGPYSSSSAGYGPSPATTAGNSTGNEDRAASQCKENNVYITGQQSEGSAVWVPAPSRDISGLQASSFYNLSPQGQHVTFPTQGGHGAFAGVYHPSQTVSATTVHPLLQPPQTMAGGVEIVGPPTGIYQQPQRAQINWTNTY
ncbi:Protein of unknown function DUF1296 [Macleaya cordata]|uniref:GBF-interacting protein 1 N-terminal domain-containing protein n=1 Tax=Macleaya cordata TaxID=56857 RepID=A0A200QCS4_MACCD|nr:Protein of unknown function DUF1296 [Macleaya cordata]